MNAEMDTSSRRGVGYWALNAVGLLGPILFLCAAVVFGVTEVHSSTDTYIGLAGGRLITESLAAGEPFPVSDTFSVNFQDQHWYNQNWLTHVWQWWLYDGIHPDAVIWGTWAMSTSIFVFVGLAVWLRTGSVLAALLAAAVVGIGFRDWISARPSTTQFFLVALFWMLICALESQGPRRRWWPIVVMLPLLVVWGNAHGSSLFGYGILALYLAYWGILWVWQRLFERRTPFWVDALVAAGTTAACAFVIWKVGVHADIRSQGGQLAHLIGQARAFTTFGTVILTAVLVTMFIRDRARPLALGAGQALVLAGVTIVALAGTALLGPFGPENFTHQFSVASTGEDAVAWREVQEWRPPYDTRRNWYPPVGRFFAITWASLGLVILAGVAFVVARVALRTPEPEEPPRAGTLRVTAFDCLMVAVGLLMAAFARRFAPYFLIFAAPTVAMVLISGTRALLWQVRPWPRYVVMLCGWIGFGLALGPARSMAERATPQLPGEGVLERVTSFRATPQDCVLYIHNNELDDVKVLAEWTHAGIIMFFAPRADVYMDGRAQQVYSVEHYRKYQQAYSRGRLDLAVADGVNAVLPKRGAGPLSDRLERNPNGWVRVMEEPQGALYLRSGSRALEQARARLDAGTEWRPDDPMARFARGNLRAHSAPVDLPGALNDWLPAMAADERLMYLPGNLARVVEALRQVRGPENTVTFLRQVLERVQRSRILRGNQKQSVQGQIQQWLRQLQQQ